MQIGDLLVGVATDQPPVRAALLEALQDHVVERALDPNYTVHLGRTASELHRIAWGGCVVARTRDVGRFATALARHLGGHRAPDPGHLRTDALAVVREGRAWLLPAVLRRRIARYEARLRKEGFAVLYSPWVDLDLAAGELVVAPPAIPTSAFGALVGLAPSSHATEPDVAGGRYPVAHWVFEGLGHGGQPWPRAEAAVLVLSNLREPPRQAPYVVSDLAALLDHVDVRMLPVEPPQDFVRLVAELP